MPLTNDLILYDRNFLPIVRGIAKKEWLRACGLVSYEEAESAVLLGLSKCLLEFDPDRGVDFGAYAYQRMRYSVRDVVQVERRQRMFVDYRDMGEKANDFGVDGLEGFTRRRELMQQVIGLLTTCLGVRERYVISRYYFEESTIREIAEDLSVSMTTIAIWKQRGLKELQKQMLWRNGGRGQLPWSEDK